jgi:hypothetical protein
MTTAEVMTAKPALHHYLKRGREVLTWKLDGLGEYDIRRPMTPTGTNLLGLVKHEAGAESAYFGAVFGRPFGEPLPWDRSGDPNSDMFATAAESRAGILGLAARIWAHADETIAALEPDAVGRVPWWPEERAVVSLAQILAHMATEAHRHAGHADIIRELIDSSAGHRPGVTSMPDSDAAWWQRYYDKVEAAARQASGLS